MIETYIIRIIVFPVIVLGINTSKYCSNMFELVSVILIFSFKHAKLGRIFKVIFYVIMSIKRIYWDLDIFKTWFSVKKEIFFYLIFSYLDTGFSCVNKRRQDR